ncbi:MAG: acyltransferase [Muribaculaceae bacterium]|nr:acyltransferase [Muribaculaceae bacterium]
MAGTPIIRTLNAWRGIFALVIVLFHSKVHLMDQAVSLGVSFFFVASGFLLTVRHHDERLTAPAAWWKFWWSHARRIYPIHWVALFLITYFFLVPEHKPFAPAEFFTQFALIHCWFPTKNFYFGYNGVSWFLGALLFCYACFPLINRYFTSLRLRWQLLAMTLIMMALWWWLPQLTGQQRIFTYVCPAIRLGDFLMGITAGNLYRLTQSNSLTYSKAKATVIELAAIGIALELLVINRHTLLLNTWDNYLLWWLPATFIVFASAMLHGQEGWLGQMLCTRPMQWLGSVSMEVYIFQNLAALIVNYYVAPVFGHFGIMIYDHNVWFQVPLLLLMSWFVNHLRTHKKNQVS